MGHPSAKFSIFQVKAIENSGWLTELLVHVGNASVFMIHLQSRSKAINAREMCFSCTFLPAALYIEEKTAEVDSIMV